jgi:hypothetical protein
MTNRTWMFCAVMGGALIPTAAFAVDGIVLISQTNALLGNVTPGDAPGFPVTISQPGSYRLSSNLTVPDANTTAIQVTGDNVTIDLNGFSILGPVVCVGEPVTSCSPNGPGAGIVTFSRMFVTVMNGTVRGMGAGIFFQGPAHVEHVKAIGNGSFGIIATDTAVVTSSTAIQNGGDGIVVQGSSIVTGSYASGNLGNGISVQGVASGNVALQNGRVGIIGTGTLSGNEVIANQGFGMSVPCPSSIVGNRVFANVAGNITTTFPGCVLAENAAP